MANDHGPQIKDDERHERLRGQGMSKEIAARHADTPASDAGQGEGRSPSYEDLSREDLYEKAKEMGIDGRAGMTKEQLIDALRQD